MEQLRYILERFFYGWKMNVLVFDQDDRLLDFCMGTKEIVRGDCKEIYEEVFLDGSNRQDFFWEIKQKCKKIDIPIIHMEEDGIYYLGFQDQEERLFVFGPAAAESLSFVQQMSFRKRHQINRQDYQISKISFSKSLNGVALLYYMITGKQVTEKEIMKQSRVKAKENPEPEAFANYIIQESTEEKQHLAYQDEVRWTADIENGTMKSREERFTKENFEKVDKIGTLANANSLKQFEYMAVTSTCLASRAAIRGGVRAYEAYRMSEIFLQRISKCSNVMEMLQIHLEISETFSNMVRQAKEKRNSDCIEQCKDYIARHRTKKFSLKDIAEAVGKNPSYLSRAFSERTGQTMQEYALSMRLEAASNILKYSNESIGGIAEYLNFPSQSYFGEKFKQKYDVSPAEYRKRYKIRDFKE